MVIEQGERTDARLLQDHAGKGDQETGGQQGQAAVGEQMRRPGKDDQKIAHSVAPGGQMRYPVAAVLTQGNRYFSDASPGPDAVDDRLGADLHAFGVDLP